MNYDSLHEAVNERYRELKEDPAAISTLKSEFGISLSVVLEILGITDELEAGRQ